MQTEIIFYFYSLQLKTLEAYKIVIMFKSTSQIWDSLSRKLYVDIKNGLNLENRITNKSVDPYTKLCKRKLSLFLPNLLSPGENFWSQKIVFLDHQV